MHPWRTTVLIVLLLFSLNACRRDTDTPPAPDAVATVMQEGGDEAFLAETLGFDLELPANAFIEVMDMGILSFDITLPFPLAEAETFIVNAFTEGGYTIDETAGPPDVNQFIRSYVFVNGEKRMEVVLQGFDDGDSTSVGIVTR